MAYARIAEQAKRWVFDFPTELDRDEFSAVRAASTFLREHRDSLPAAIVDNPVQLALLAIKVCRLFLRPNGDANEVTRKRPDADLAREILADLEATWDRAEDRRAAPSARLASAPRRRR